jgi:hypothetical protein
MVTWDHEAAIAYARQNVDGDELFAWLPQFETDDAFAYAVLYGSHVTRGWLFRRTTTVWKVAAYRKRPVPGFASTTWVDLDALPEAVPAIALFDMTMVLNSPEEAVSFILHAFDLTELTDYDAIAARFRARYPHCVTAPPTPSPCA